jgi:serine/threonine-protein kinase SRK2
LYVVYLERKVLSDPCSPLHRMGACASKPKVDENKNSAGPAKQPPKPDFGFGDAYDVVKLLGAGGEGETWLCTDKESGEEVAIKVRPP